MKKNKIFLPITLILLLLSVYSTEVSKDTSDSEDTLTKNIKKNTDIKIS